MNRLLIRKTLRDLRANMAQSVALIVIVALGIASFTALIGAYRDLGTSYERTYDELHFANVTLDLSSVPQGVIGDVDQLAGVSGATGRLIVDTGLELADGNRIRSRLLGLPAGEQPAVNRLLIEEGRYLQRGDHDAALIEAHFAEIYNLHPGDTITPLVDGQTRELQIVGVAASPEYLIVSPSRQDIFPSARTFAVLFVPRDRLQELQGVEGQINNLALTLESGADRGEVVAAARQTLPEGAVNSVMMREENPSHAALQLDLEGYREIALFMPGLILFVAAISVYIMLGRLVRSQQPQIGLMKALGYSDRAILWHYLAVALIISLLGAVLGIAGGLPLARFITTAYAQELGIPLVQTSLYPDLIALSSLLSVILAILAGAGPARHSAQQAPATAMRRDPAVHMVDGSVSLVERLIILPLWLRLPLRNVLRLRRRSLTTGLGIVFAFVLVLMVWGMLDSMNYFIRHTYEDIERWDMLATFANPQDTALLEEIRQWPGVNAAEPAIQAPATIMKGEQEEDVLLTALPLEQNMHRLQLARGLNAEEALGEGQLVLTEAMAQQLAVAPGEQLTLDTPLGRHTVTLGGVTDELLSAAAYISLDRAQQLSGAPAPFFNTLYLKVDGQQTSTLRDDLYGLPGAAGVQLKSEARRDVESLMGLFYVFMGVMLLFALTMAFALIFNAMTVNVLERQREMATMRAVGAGGRRIAAQIVVENIVLWLLALAPGLLLGRWVAGQMGQAFSADLFTFRIVIDPLSYALTAAGVLATMLVAAAPAVRRVNRLDLAEATKVLT